MTDELAGLTVDAGAPAATPPAPSEADIEARLNAKFDERVKGFQKLLDEQQRARQQAEQQLAELQASGMSEDEKAELQWNSLQEKVSQLQTENALLSLQSKYPEEMPIFKSLLDGTSPEEQLQVIRALRVANKAAAEAESDDEPDVPNVDPNNPLPVSQPSGPVFNGKQMDEDWADRLLASVKRMRP